MLWNYVVLKFNITIYFGLKLNKQNKNNNSNNNKVKEKET